MIFIAVYEPQRSSNVLRGDDERGGSTQLMLGRRKIRPALCKMCLKGRELDAFCHAYVLVNQARQKSEKNNIYETSPAAIKPFG